MIDKFQQRFIDEAKEHFENMELSLMNLESDFTNTELVGEIFRSMHSLKGSGAMFGFTLLSDATHEMESLYDSVRNGSVAIDSSIISFTLHSLDLLKQLLTLTPDNLLKEQVDELKVEILGLIKNAGNSSGGGQPVSNNAVLPKGKPVAKKWLYIYFKPAPNVMENGTNPLYLIEELHTLGECLVVADLSEVPELKSVKADKCYLSWKCLLYTDQDYSDIEDVFLFVKEESRLEIIQVKNEALLKDEGKRDELLQLSVEKAMDLALNEEEVIQPDRVKAGGAVVSPQQALSSIRVGSSKIDEYMNLVSEMITAQSRLMLFAENRRDPEAELIAETFEKLIRQLRDNAFDMSLVPLFNMVARFKRLVRDLSAEMGKDIELETEGLDTEVDKNMIEKLTDPLLHIVRNCIDHGIEKKEERVAAGKLPTGKIFLKASYVGTFVQIEVGDDGAGLDLEKIRKHGIDRDILSLDDEIGKSELMELILKPGFSTAEAVSDVSGRGVGMDVVARAIKTLRGSIDIESKPGEGTKFIIRLPLTLSIIDGLLTKVNDEFFVIPTGNIKKIYALDPVAKENRIRQVQVFDGVEIPFLNLRHEFDAQANETNHQYMIAVKVNDDQLFGLVVDDVLREYQAVVKPLGKILKKQDIFLGASILGDGKIALVIDINKIIQKFSA